MATFRQTKISLAVYALQLRRRKPLMQWLHKDHQLKFQILTSACNKYGWRDVVIDRKTHITSTTADFPCKAQDDVTSIASLSKVAPQQLVAIKGMITHLSATKTIVIQGSPVKKQVGYIVDPSGYIRIIFTGTYQNKAINTPWRMLNHSKRNYLMSLKSQPQQ